MTSTSKIETNRDEPAAYRVPEFCEKVRMSRSRFYEKVRLGRIRVLKDGRRSLVPATEVPRYLGSLRPLRSI